MRCLMLAALAYLMGFLVLVLAVVAVPLDHCARLVNRVMDWAEIEYLLAVIARKTRAQGKARRPR